jgi:hypothetical protein
MCDRPLAAALRDRIFLPAISLMSTPQGKGKALPCPYHLSEFAIAFAATLSAFCHIKHDFKLHIRHSLTQQSQMSIRI